MELTKTKTIDVRNLSLSYYSFTKKKGLFGSVSLVEVKALVNVSFSVYRGESLALLGRNGAGKSTLLSAIGGQLRPKSGKITTIGRVFTLRGANPGLIPSISPRQNIRQLLAAYGIEKEKWAEFEREVEQFCDLGEAYDRNLSTLSSGMSGRVGFGFTTSLRPQILLMDETLGVGDEKFRKKAQLKAENFMQSGETIILSTHSLNLAKNICNRGIVLDEGKIIFDGAIDSAVEEYLKIYS